MDDLLSESATTTIIIILCAAVLTITIIMGTIGMNLRRGFQGAVYDSMVAGIEREIFQINVLGEPLPVTGVIHFIQKSSDVITQVRSIDRIRVNARGELLPPLSGSYIDASHPRYGQFVPSLIKVNKEYHGLDASLKNPSGKGILIDNSGYSLINNLSFLIGEHVYIFIVRENDGQFTAYISDKGEWL